MHDLVERGVEENLKELLMYSPIVHIEGARQVGKSTLASVFAQEDSSRFTQVTLDNENALNMAQQSPQEFVRLGGEGTLIIDEIQRMPGLTLAIKETVDQDRRPGRFIITGSSDLARVRGLKDSLAGRSMSVHLYPLSLQEQMGALDQSSFVDRLDELTNQAAVATQYGFLSREAIAKLLEKGGYPGIQGLPAKIRRRWFGDYLERLIRIDADLGRSIAEANRPARLSAMLRLLAAQPATEFVQAKIAREAKIPESTARDYFDALDRLFLISSIRPWTPNLSKREIAKPKIWLTDCGFSAYLAGQTAEKYADITQESGYGHAVEALVLQELCSQKGWSSTDYELYHWRDRDGKEVDAVLELFDGSIIAIEIKSGTAVRGEYFKHLRFFQEKLGSKFRAGIVLCATDQALSFGDRLYALPLQTLWTSQPSIPNSL